MGHGCAHVVLALSGASAGSFGSDGSAVGDGLEAARGQRACSGSAKFVAAVESFARVLAGVADPEELAGTAVVEELYRSLVAVSVKSEAAEEVERDDLEAPVVWAGEHDGDQAGVDAGVSEAGGCG